MFIICYIQFFYNILISVYVNAFLTLVIQFRESKFIVQCSIYFSNKHFVLEIK
jgi:hypothetical protein